MPDIAQLPRQLTLSVLDSGVGISREFLPRVFELFSQGAAESSHSGLGIGLALARRLVECTTELSMCGVKDHVAAANS